MNSHDALTQWSETEGIFLTNSHFTEVFSMCDLTCGSMPCETVPINPILQKRKLKLGKERGLAKLT